MRFVRGLLGLFILKWNGNPARKVTAISSGKLRIEEDVEEIFEKRVTPYGNGAKIDAQKKYIGRRVYIIVLKKD